MKKFFIIVLVLLILEIIPIIGYMYITDMKRMNKGKPVIFSNWGYAYSTISKSEEIEETEFTKTYNIIKSLDIEDQTGEYCYYVVEQFQGKRPAIAKIDKKFNIEENTNYEISFRGYKNITEYEIEEIFDNFSIIDIKKTDKQGLEQINDEI